MLYSCIFIITSICYIIFLRFFSKISCKSVNPLLNFEISVMEVTLCITEFQLRCFAFSVIKKKK